MKHKNLNFVISICSIFAFYGIIFTICFFTRNTFPEPGVRDNAYEKADLKLINELTPSNIEKTTWNIGGNEVITSDSKQVIQFKEGSVITSSHLSPKSHLYVEIVSKEESNIHIEGFTNKMLLQSGSLTKENDYYYFAFSFNFYNINTVSFTNIGKTINIDMISIYKIL